MRKTVLGNSNTPDVPLEGSLIAVLPEELRAVMKPVTKWTLNIPPEATTTTDYTFLMAEFEIFGVRTYSDKVEQSKQAQYDYFKAGNPKVFYKHSDTTKKVVAWMRSPLAGSSVGFCNVASSGTVSSYLAGFSLGVAPGFCA